MFEDVAVAAKEDTLNIFWHESPNPYVEQDDDRFRLMGYTIEDATQYDPGFSSLSNGAILDFIIRDTGTRWISLLDVDWDTYIDKARIVWLKREYESAPKQLNAARVIMQNGQPYSLDVIYTISEPLNHDSKYPEIVANRSIEHGMAPSDVKEAFCVFTNWDGHSYQNEVDVIDGSDMWLDNAFEVPEDQGDGSLTPGVTYRYFGTECRILEKSDDIITSSYGVLDDSGNNYSPRICTNIVNGIDIFPHYMEDENANTKLIIRQIKP